MFGVDEEKISEGKYGYKNKEAFPDPVVRCDSCQALIRRKHVHTMGCCPECGNKRFRNVLTLKDTEMEKMKEWNIDPEFIALFEGVNLES